MVTADRGVPRMGGGWDWITLLGAHRVHTNTLAHTLYTFLLLYLFDEFHTATAREYEYDALMNYGEPRRRFNMCVSLGRETKANK